MGPLEEHDPGGLANYIDAGSIVAGAAGLSLWTTMFHLSSSFVGLIGAISSNAISAGVGALVGGRLCDKFGRKKIYQWDMLLYAFGLLFIIFASAPRAFQPPQRRRDALPYRYVRGLELFPTLLRSTAQGLMFAVVRISLGFWSLFVPTLTKTGFSSLAWILTGFVAFSGLIGFLFAPRNEGKSLAQIQHERHGTVPAPQTASVAGA